MWIMKTIFNVVKDIVKGAGEKNLSVYAAGSAFFVILSAVPIIIVISCIIPFSGLTEEILYDVVTTFLPATTKDFMISLISYVYSNTTGMLPVAVIVAIWSAGKGMLSLIRGLNGIYGIVEKRGYIRLRIVSSLYTVLLLVGLVFTLVVSVFGRSIYENFLITIPILREIFSLVLKFRFALATFVLSIIYTILYTYVPNMKTSLKKQFYGACLASVASAVFSYCFSVYVDNFNDFSNYGSINTIIIIMLWLYFTMYILLYGAYIGSCFMRSDTGES